MFLTISTTHRPATDLGYLLHKNPFRMQSVDLSFGKAQIFYPEASEERCTAALLLEVDPVDLVRHRSGGPALEQYVNDRPYAVCSFMSVAIARSFGTALGGRSKERPELANRAIPLRAEMPTVPCRGGAELIHRLFSPLGYAVETEGQPLDPQFPEWGDSPYYRVTLEATCRLQDLLSHLYVLIPVLDNRKHYWVGEEEIEKLLHRGEGWLSDHPDRELIVSRYLKHRSPLTRLALERLSHEDEADLDDRERSRDEDEEVLEAPIRLHEQRLSRVHSELDGLGARRVGDLGCGDGKLLQKLLRSGSFDKILGLDVSLRSLEHAHRRLRLEDAAPRVRERVELLHGSITYVDPRLEGLDAATLVEVIEHLDPPRLSAAERVVWGHARPASVLVTTPNREFNVRFENLRHGGFRHGDHRFEWSREEFRDWATGVADRFGYSVRFQSIGTEDPELGAPTQMATFERCD